MTRTYFAGAHIILVEDDVKIAEILAELLQRWGARVRTFFDGDAAVLAAATLRRRPDLIIAAYRLPGEHNGVAVINLIRAELGHDVPGVVVTGDTNGGVIAEARRNDCVLLHEPARAKVLKAALMDRLRRQSH